MVCACPSSPCRGKSPREWQFMQRGCRNTDTNSTKTAPSLAVGVAEAVVSPLTPTQPIENTDRVSDGSLWLSQPPQRGGPCLVLDLSAAPERHRCCQDENLDTDRRGLTLES